MTSRNVRSLMAQLAFATAVCAGLHAVVATPLRERALRAEADLNRFVSRYSDAAEELENLPRIVQTREQIESEASEFAARNRAALNESTMFAEVLEMADRSGVRLEQISPAGPAAPPRDAAKPRPGDKHVRYTLSGSGPYSGAADFIERLQGDWAHCAVRQCRLTPDYQAGAQGAVKLSITIDLFSFDAGPVTLADDREDAP